MLYGAGSARSCSSVNECKNNLRQTEMLRLTSYLCRITLLWDAYTPFGWKLPLHKRPARKFKTLPLYSSILSGTLMIQTPFFPPSLQRWVAALSTTTSAKVTEVFVTDGLELSLWPDAAKSYFGSRLRSRKAWEMGKGRPVGYMRTWVFSDGTI